MVRAWFFGNFEACPGGIELSFAGPARPMFVQLDIEKPADLYVPHSIVRWQNIDGRSGFELRMRRVHRFESLRQLAEMN